MLQARGAEKERELGKVYQEKEKQLYESQVSFARKLAEAEQQMAMLRLGKCCQQLGVCCGMMAWGGETPVPRQCVPLQQIGQ